MKHNIIINKNLDCKYHMAKGKSYDQYSISKTSIGDAHLLFYYNEEKKSFIVWNASLIKGLKRGTANLNFYSGTKCCELLKENMPNNISTFVKSICYNNKYDYNEKIAVVPENLLLDFCLEYEEYIYPNYDDLNNNNFITAFPDCELILYDKSNDAVKNKETYAGIVRKRDAIKRARRNPNFRQNVLQKFNNTCIICGCKENEILEAAHIRGVAEGGDDSVENGICLCRNHHKLYDSALLEIDWENKKFKCDRTSEIEMSWYKEAANRGFQLLLKERL